MLVDGWARGAGALWGGRSAVSLFLTYLSTLFTKVKVVHLWMASNSKIGIRILLLVIGIIVNRSVLIALSIGSGPVVAVLLCMKRESIDIWHYTSYVATFNLP